MDKELLSKIIKWRAEGDLRPFYRTKEWRKKRKEILEQDRYECQWCKDRGFFEPANTVHHVQYLDKYPELALSDTYTYEGKEYRQLISLCRECHEEHHEHLKTQPRGFVNVERW